MDPLSALSISAVVVQFADFGYRLLKGAHEIYTSPTGQSANEIQLSAVFDDLSRISSEVKTKLTAMEEQVALSSSSVEVFLSLARQCEEAGKSLQAIFSKFDRQGSKIKLAGRSWAAVLKEFAADTEIKQLQVRLHNIREQMMIALLSLLL